MPSWFEYTETVLHSSQTLLLSCAWAVSLAGCSNPEPPAAEDSCPDTGYAPCPEGFATTTDVVRTLPTPTTVPDGPLSIAVGDLAGVGTPQVYVGTMHTVTRLDGQDWSVATDLWTQPGDGTALHPVVADLTGDGVADLVIGLPGSDGGKGQVVVFPGPVVEPVSWDTPHFEIKGEAGAGFGLAARDFDGDGNVDLLAQGEQLAWIKHGPVLGDDVFGVDADTVWVSSEEVTLNAAAAGDFNGDGIADLAFTVYVDSPKTCPWFGNIGLSVAMGPMLTGSFEVGSAIPLDVPTDTFLLPSWIAVYADNVIRDVFLAQSQIADIDADGVDDLVAPAISRIAFPYTGLLEVVVFTGPFQNADVPAARFAVDSSPLGVADFNGDGVADLLEAGADHTGPTVLTGPLSALPGHDVVGCTFHVGETWVSTSPLPAPVAAWTGDLNGDGAGDAVLSTGTDNDDAGLVQVVLGGS